MSGYLIQSLTAPGSMRVVFQPIVDLRSPRPLVHALEGLTRGPRGTNLESPDILFEYARRRHDEALVDRVAMSTILGEAARLSPDLEIHLNVHASTVNRDPSLANFLSGLLAKNAIAPARVTLEVLEQSNPIDAPLYLEALGALRALGLKIALDDIGVGSSNFQMVLLTRPTMLKVDRTLIDGIADDPYQRAALSAIQLIARQAEATVVAEGIENERDLAVLLELGVEYGQGFYFARPLPPDAVLGFTRRTSLPALSPVLEEGPLELAAAG